MKCADDLSIEFGDDQLIVRIGIDLVESPPITFGKRIFESLSLLAEEIISEHTDDCR